MHYCGYPLLTQFDKSQCEPILGSNSDPIVDLDTIKCKTNADFILIEPGLNAELEVKVLFKREISSGDLKITYPSEDIIWLTDSIA